MQDRFKFRFFNKIANKMVLPINYANVDCIYECLAQQVCYDEDIQPLPYDHIGNGIVFMQCTGLRDKNGKLIYEGDILRSEEYPFKNEESYNYAAEVLWDDASATFYYYTFRISTNVVGRAEGNTGNLNDYEWEVIGNRYENPELLED